MPKVHQVAYLSILFPLYWPFSAGYSWFVYLKFLPDPLFEDGTGWQCCAWPQALLGKLWRFCQWSGILHRLSPFVVFQSEGRSLHGTSSWRAWHQQLCMAMLSPTLTHSQWRRGCTRNLGTFGMAPWSQCPTHQIFQFEGCSGGALHWEKWCHLAAGISDTFGWTLWCLRTSLARRTRIAKFWLECGMPHSGLRMEMHGTFWWFVYPPPSARTFSASHRNISYRGTGRPKGDVCFQFVASSYSCLVVHTLKPWNWQCSCTTGLNLSPLATCHHVGSHWLVVPTC